MASEEKKQSFLSKYWWTIFIVLAVAGIVCGIYFYTKYQKAQKLLQNPTLAAQMQTDDLLTKVGKLIELPQDESPTIATVSDITKLKNQPFFANGKNGDKVLIYTTAKKAILYDPELNKIINVEPITLGNTTVTPSVTPSPTPVKKK